MWDQEQKIMFCDVSTLEPDARAYVLAMKPQIATAKVAALNNRLGCGFTCDFVGGSGRHNGDGNGGEQHSILVVTLFGIF